MKPGKDVELKIKSVAKAASAPGKNIQRQQRLATLWVVTALWFAQIACSTGYVSQARLTATAGGPDSIAAVPNTKTTALSALPAATEPASPAPTMAQPTTALVAQATPEQPAATPTAVPPTPTSAAQTPAAGETATLPPGENNASDPPILYYTQAGDTLSALAARFNVTQEEITSPEQIPTEGLFNPGVLLLIPDRLGETSPSTQLMPDSEVAYSPSALDFDVEEFISNSSGYLSTYREWRSTGWFTGPGVIRRVAIENSINPRLLLVILEYQSHWVYGQPENLAQTDYPIGWLHLENEKKGLYYQLSWAVQQLNIGYYGWREGTVTELTFPDGQKLRLAPDLNAGTVSLLYLFSRLYNEQEWAGLLYGTDNLTGLFETMVGSPWLRAQSVEPLFPATLTQPPLELPFLPGHTWAFTGGPHSAWGQGAVHPRAALDFAPSAVEGGCVKTEEWATASASGVVVRSENGVVVLDLDGDGYEQTGWSILYLHIAAEGRIPVGTWLNLNDKIGHPSCEGGVATGTHVHMARKYNGEWILADGAMPFVLSGWRAHADTELYIGTMTKGDQTAYSSTFGTFESKINRPVDPTN